MNVRKMMKGELMNRFDPTLQTQTPIPGPVPGPPPVPQPNPLPNPDPEPPPVPSPSPLPNPDPNPLPDPDPNPLPDPSPPPGGLFFARHQPTMQVYVDERYAYQVIVRNLGDEKPLDEEALNQLGKQGWELTAAFTHGDRAYFYLKRQER